MTGAHVDHADHEDAAHVDEHDDGDGHGGEALGPIDWRKWGYAVVGGLGGLIVIAFFFFALGGMPS